MLGKVSCIYLFRAHTAVNNHFQHVQSMHDIERMQFYRTLSFVQDAPQLIMISPEGKVISGEGVLEVENDPEGEVS